MRKDSRDDKRRGEKRDDKKRKLKIAIPEKNGP